MAARGVEQFPGIREVVEKIAVNAVGRVERPLMLSEELARLDGDHKLSEGGRDTVEGCYEAGKLGIGFRAGSWPCHP